MTEETPMGDDRPDFIEHAFRHNYGRIVARLIRKFGPRNLDLVEESAQDAFLAALRSWPFEGPPDNALAWLLRVAENRAIDRLRRSARFDDILALKDLDVADSEPRPADETDSFRSVNDDTLRLIFMCCHPALSRTVRVTLTLKTVCGFTTGEIADAFGSNEPTVAQRITRAKRTLRDGNAAFDLPPQEDCTERLPPVLDVLFLLFNEGYRSANGPSPIRHDLVEEAIRLAELLAEIEIGRRPEIAALRALFWLQSSRLKSRIDTDGAMIPLARQNRESWDHGRIARGLRCLSEAGKGSLISDYHLLAEIAAVHATATSFEATDWERIVQSYDVLHSRCPSFVIDLNRTVAIAEARGAKQGLRELIKLKDHPSAQADTLFFSTEAEFLLRCGRNEEALVSYREAIRISGNSAEKKYLEAQVTDLLERS